MVTDMSGMITAPDHLERTIEKICSFIREISARSGRKHLVIGLSGGIDSSLSAALAVRALGNSQLFGIMMPYHSSSAESLTDAKALADWLQIETTVEAISPMVDAYFANRDADQLRRGNKMARERMSILFDYAHQRNALVVGTGNRTEIALGYTTWYGDSACSFNPIGELYKTEVRAMAKHLGMPKSIIEKAPSADLWSGQTDEGEIGVSYEMIDQILVALLDDSVRNRRGLEKHFPTVSLTRVIELINRHYYKRQLPSIAPLSKKPIPERIELSE